MQSIQLNGFILTAHREDAGGSHRLRYHGVSDNGPFEIIISNSKPLFFIEKDADISCLNMATQRKTVALKSFAGRDVDALYFNEQKKLFEAKDILAEKGIRTYESDVRPEARYLMERFINGSILIEGHGAIRNGILEFVNPKLSKSNYIPKLSTLSVDIETSMGNDLYSIGLHFVKGKTEFKHVFMVGDKEEKVHDEMTILPGEKEVLVAFLKKTQLLDPDLIIGWHVIGFDLMFLERKCKQFHLDFCLGRKKSSVRLTERKGAGFFAYMEGRVVIDGPPTLRSAFYSFENFKLETVARELLGVGKDIAEAGSGKVEEITRRFNEDKVSLAKYNLMDCTLVTDIYNKTGVIDQLITRSILSGLLIDRIGISTAAFDHFLLPLVHRKGFVAPNVLDIQRDAHAAGGFVMEPKAGLHKNVVVLDFKSLYPTIIRTFCIDPYSRLMAETDPVETPVGIKFSRSHNLLPDFIRDLMEQREMAKNNQDPHLSQAIKILMNSFYGVMGSPGSRFYHADLPTAITGTGQWILKSAIDFLEIKGYDVIYGDTDSVFVKLKEDEIKSYKDRSYELAREINSFISHKLKIDFKINSKLEIQFEKFYKKFYLPSVRGGGGGAKKRYAGLLVLDHEEELTFSGMEYVRSDWTKVAKKFQYEIFHRLFYNEDMENYIRDFVEEVKAGDHDSELVYKKRLTKPINEYVKSIPPHVKAAKMLEDQGIKLSRTIEYVITRRGPVPVELEHSDIDYQHYIDRQIKPLADDLLYLFEKSFDDLVQGDQLTLF